MIKKHHLPLILKAYRDYLKQQKNPGFTLLELLMAMLVASIVVYAMLSLVVSLLGTEKRETAKSQTQIEMGQAMDYIASEIEQAAYIYEGACLVGGRGNLGDNQYCPGLTNVISFPDGLTPVLAFWQLEPVPYTSDGQLPARCDTMGALAQECYAIKNSRSSYTLVVYGLRTDNTGTWEGPARITRYQLRKYKSDELLNLTITDNYIDPQDTGFQTWPCSGNTCTIAQITEYNDSVLVDLVDQDDATITLTDLQGICSDYNYGPTGSQIQYSLSPPTDTSDNFYACVAEPSGSGNYQDAVVFIRGNAATRAGKPGSRNPIYLPNISRRVKAGTLIERTPPITE